MPPDGRRDKADTGKRAGLPRRADFTRQFVKDWDRLNRTARYDMRQLKRVMLLLISNEGPLPAEWKDHALKGDWADHRECHVGGDFLLVYTLDEKANLVVFTRAGTHSELFE
jgi:mRNA interferase YafQ